MFLKMVFSVHLYLSMVFLAERRFLIFYVVSLIHMIYM